MKTNLFIFITFIITILTPYNIYGQSNESDELFGKGIDAFNKKMYYESINLFKKADKLDSIQIPLESNRLGYCKSWIAHCYYLLGDETKAKETSEYDYFFKPVDRRLTIESDNEEYLSFLALNKGNLKEALHHALKCIELEEKILGKESLHYIGSCMTLYNIYSQLHDDSNALKFCEMGLENLQSLGIRNNFYNFQFLQGRLYSHLNQGSVDLATNDLSELERICNSRDFANGNKYPYALTKMLSARIELQGKANYEGAGQHATEAFNMMVDLYQPENEELFSSMYDCISILSMSGKYYDAINIISLALDRLEQSNLKSGHKGILLSCIGEFSNDPETSLDFLERSAKLLKNSEYIDMYNSNKCMIASLKCNTGDYTTAINLYNEVCNYYEHNDTTQGTYRNALMNLGDIYNQTGDFIKAAEYYKIILDLLSYDKSNIDYILTFIKWIPICANASASENYIDGYEKGVNISQELKEIFPNIKISDLIDNGIGLGTLAEIFHPFYNFLLSNATINFAISWKDIENQLNQMVYENLMPIYSIKNQTTLRYIAALAHTKYILGDYSNAISLMNQIIDTSKEMGWECGNYIHDLAYYQYDSGDTLNAFYNFESGYNFLKEQIISNYRWMNLEERTKYTNAHRGNIDNIPHYAAITPLDRRYACLSYNSLLFSKGLLLNSTIELTRLLQEEGDDNTLNLLTEWRQTNQQLQSITANLNSENLDEIRFKANKLEKQLLEKSKIYGDYTKGLTVMYEDVQRKLDNDDIAIEFFSFQKDAKSRQYGALILTKTEIPRYVTVGIDSEWHNIDLKQDCYESTELFNILFKNLKKYLPKNNSGKVYFAADGILHNIAIENLPGSEDYNLIRLTSTREIALNKKDSAKTSCMALFGGVSYGLGEVASFYSSPIYDTSNSNRESTDFLSYLPETVIESNQIYNLLSSRIHVTKMTAEEASEENFKALSGQGIALLHIATHGYFNSMSHTTSKYNEPLLSSGLYLAGAQNTLWDEQIPEMTDDGVLSAYEISMLDLRGLKLAVLSSCETGLGFINPDGVFGLQRGFKQAGAESIMMSLWKVDDKATQILMNEFYKNLVIEGNQYDALKKAQNTVRQQYPNPYYWAGFILIDANKQIKI